MKKDYKIWMLEVGAIGSFFILADFANVARNRSIYLKNDLPVVESISDLEDILSKEQSKIGLSNVGIDLEVNDTCMIGVSRKIDEGRYKITVNPNLMSPLVIRHELYHIHCWENPSFFAFGPIQEWLATSYSIRKD